jgi:hypothetical protein
MDFERPRATDRTSLRFGIGRQPQTPRCCVVWRAGWGRKVKTVQHPRGVVTTVDDLLIHHCSCGFVFQLDPPGWVGPAACAAHHGPHKPPRSGKYIAALCARSFSSRCKIALALPGSTGARQFVIPSYVPGGSELSGCIYSCRSLRYPLS